MANASRTSTPPSPARARTPRSRPAGARADEPAAPSSSSTCSRRTGLVAPDRSRSCAAARARAVRSRRRSWTKASRPAEGIARILADALRAAARRPRADGRRRRRPRARCRCTSSSASSRSRTRSRTGRSASRSPTRRTSTRSTSCGSRRASPLELGVASREDIDRRDPAGSPARPRRFGARGSRSRRSSSPIRRRRRRRTTSRPTTASPTRRSSGSSTRSSSRPPRTAPRDIHFEPQEDALVVRFRIDGVLHEVQRIPKRMCRRRDDAPEGAREARHRRAPEAAGRPHLAERGGSRAHARHPRRDAADGRGREGRHASARQVEEAADAGASSGSPSRCRTRLAADRRARPTGALLVTGPTGSGKSTTLFACADQINRPEINIITVEDPVEYRLAGVNQVQINPRAGLDVRGCAALDPPLRPRRRDGRRDPRRRDREDGDRGRAHRPLRALDAAHERRARARSRGCRRWASSRSSPARRSRACSRSGSRGKLCTHCCGDVPAVRRRAAKARVSPDVAAASDGMVFYRKRGCPRCGQTGYKGRIGDLPAAGDDGAAPSRSPRTKATREELERAALGEGMRTLWDDGLAKVAAGLTSVEELARVTVERGRLSRNRRDFRTHLVPTGHDRGQTPAVSGRGTRVCRLRANAVTATSARGHDRSPRPRRGQSRPCPRRLLREHVAAEVHQRLDRLGDERRRLVRVRERVRARADGLECARREGLGLDDARVAVVHGPEDGDRAAVALRVPDEQLLRAQSRPRAAPSGEATRRPPISGVATPTTRRRRLSRSRRPARSWRCRRNRRA